MSTILDLPVRSDLDGYSFSIELDAVTYLLRFRYNDRMSVWLMDIADTGGNDVLSGVPLLTNCDLIGRFRSDALPPGRFLAFDTTGNAANAGRNDLGNNVKLLYQAATF